MRILPHVFSILALSFGAGFAMPVAAQEAVQTERAAAAAARGALLWAYDQAAWHATDQFQIDFATGYPPETRGYVVEPSETGGYDVTFYGEAAERVFGIARYHWATGASVVGGRVTGADAELGDRAKRMIGARNTALRSVSSINELFFCSNSPPNTIVLPPDQEGAMTVYLLSATTDATTYPLGGHNRIDIAADGRIAASRPFMKGCFPVSWKEQEGVKPEMFFVTHVLDDQPNEIDFFVSRNIPISMMIGAGGYVWPIANGVLSKPELLPH